MKLCGGLRHKRGNEGYNCDLVFASGSGPERAAMYGAVKAFIQSDTTGTGPDMWFDQFEEKEPPWLMRPPIVS